MSQWIADEIIHQGTIRGSLAEAIEYFLRVARYVLRLNNFNTFFQIVSALSKQPACLPSPFYSHGAC
jgi:hypothetical protein